MCVVISIYDSQSYFTMQFIKQWKLQSLNADEHRAHLRRPDYFSYQLDSSLVFCPSPGFLSLLFKLLAALICDRAFTFSLHLVVCHHRWQGGDLADQSAASPLCVNKQRHRAVTSFHLLLTPSHLWDVTESDNDRVVKVVFFVMRILKYISVCSISWMNSGQHYEFVSIEFVILKQILSSCVLS